MPQETESKQLSVAEFASRFGGQLVPLTNRFSYFFTALPFSDDDVREYLEEPVKALPPLLRSRLPQIAIILVPYLQKGRADEPPGSSGEDYICFEPPDKNHQISVARLVSGKSTFLLFAMKDQEVADYHYRLFHALADLAAEVSGDEVSDQFHGVLRDELSSGAHGELDKGSWDLKQALLRRQRNMRRKTKGFAKYARQAMIDTLTLYLHGICCDIDIETGPRQLATRHLRRRLELLQSIFPPPQGYAVFPEDNSETK